MAARPAPLTRALGLAAAGLAVAWLGGCAPGPLAPVAERSPVFRPAPDNYRVQKSDSLYSIAWRFELDVEALARANGLEPPYTIFPGQTLRLKVAPTAPRPPAAPPAAVPGGWRWPTTAAVVREYGSGSRGMDFRLAGDERIAAAATGDVVYAGNGLGGYRHLVILRHGPRYLSAYGFDPALAVREGQQVKAGAPLADIKGRGRAARMLHFEIRKDGEAVDPRSVIKR